MTAPDQARYRRLQELNANDETFRARPLEQAGVDRLVRREEGARDHAQPGRVEVVSSDRDGPKSGCAP